MTTHIEAEGMLPNLYSKEGCLAFIEQWKNDWQILRFFRSEFANLHKLRLVAQNGWMDINELKEYSKILIKCSEVIETLEP